ncbi:MAG: RlpA-like double-psi beta-barrel domain-containing protein [bacterium]
MVQCKRAMKLILIISIFVLPNINFTAAEESANQEFFIRLDAATIAKGYTVTAFENKIKLSLVPGILSEATGVDVVILNEDMNYPWQVDKISQVYQFEFRNKAAYDDHKPFYIQMSYDKDDDNYKQVFFYDKNYGAWRPLPTRDYPGENFVRSLIHLPFARIAIFSYPKVLTNGKASWYKFKSGNYAASPDFPKGSIIRVHNKNNNKYVDVEINDYGPDRSIFPDRAIDLEKEAFAKIASLSAGTVDIKLEPLLVLPDADGKIMGIAPQGAKSEFEISMKSGIVMEEGTGKIIWAKKENEALPLASLTKLAAMKVFMETNPDMERVVAYSEQDKEYNYEDCDRKYSISSLNMEEGETIKVKDLFYSSIIGSTNNTVESLVRVSGLTREEFVSRMNNFAQEIGASSTFFFDPTGLSPKNMSSARDYAIITKEALQNQTIAAASITKEYKFKTGSDIDHTIRNTNNLLRYNLVGNITGSKTGYLIEAGYCLMTRVANQFGNLIVVTMGAEDKDTSFAQTKDLIEFGLKKILPAI